MQDEKLLHIVSAAY